MQLTSARLLQFKFISLICRFVLIRVMRHSIEVDVILQPERISVLSVEFVLKDENSAQAPTSRMKFMRKSSVRNFNCGRTCDKKTLPCGPTIITKVA